MAESSMPCAVLFSVIARPPLVRGHDLDMEVVTLHKLAIVLFFKTRPTRHNGRHNGHCSPQKHGVSFAVSAPFSSSCYRSSPVRLSVFPLGFFSCILYRRWATFTTYSMPVSPPPTRWMSPPPVYDSRRTVSDSGLTPYLQLPHLLSLTWLASPI